MTTIGEELRVPLKSDEAGWKELVALILIPWRDDPAQSRRAALEVQLRYLNALGVTEERLNEIHRIEAELRQFPERS